MNGAPEVPARITSVQGEELLQPDEVAAMVQRWIRLARSPKCISKGRIFLGNALWKKSLISSGYAVIRISSLGFFVEILIGNLPSKEPLDILVRSHFPGQCE